MLFRSSSSSFTVSALTAIDPASDDQLEYMKPSRSTRVQDKTCFAGDDLILFVSMRQTTLDYFYVLNRHIDFGITVFKMINLDIFGSSRGFFYWDILLYPVTAR